MPVPLVEEGVVPEVFISGIGRIERLSGGMVRITFYSERYNEHGHIERIVAAKLIRPFATWQESLRVISEAMSDTAPKVSQADGATNPLDS